MNWTTQARAQGPAIVILLVGMFMFWQATLLKVGTPSSPGPGLFPLGLSGALTVLGVALLLEGRGTTGDAAPATGATQMGYRSIAIVLGLVLALALTVETLGFVIAGAVLTCALLRLAGRDWRSTFIIGISASVLSYLLFDYALKVPLPRGLLDGLF